MSDFSRPVLWHAPLLRRAKEAQALLDLRRPGLLVQMGERFMKQPLELRPFHPAKEALEADASPQGRYVLRPEPEQFHQRGLIHPVGPAETKLIIWRDSCRDGSVLIVLLVFCSGLSTCRGLCLLVAHGDSGGRVVTVEVNSWAIGLINHRHGLWM